MATLLLSAAGAALGSGFGGTVLGLSGAVIGRAVGATLGQAIDRKLSNQRVLGAGSDAVDIGKIDRLRLTSASEGGGVAQIWGRQRVSGQVIWATRFNETVATSTSGGGGKGAAPATPVQTINSYSYTVSIAIALCAGEILRVGRIWADGNEIAPDSLNMRVYRGTDAQMPDPRIEAVEGTGMVPAFRGIAYVVIDDLPLGTFGGRVPQLSFEVLRPAQANGAFKDLSQVIPGVALMPGTGEYALASTPVHYVYGQANRQSVNKNSISGKTDLITSLENLGAEVPSCKSVSLVVSWFAGDLRAAECTLRPKVEQRLVDGEGMPWQVSGLHRASADLINTLDNRPIYGGTPTDTSVIEAIQAIKAEGHDVTFYPFVLMDQLAENGLPDPYSDAADQPVLPWRGRITANKAPGMVGSPDGTPAATAQIDAFFGAATAAQFSHSAAGVTYSGPDEWRYRRFILHYAHLCAAAGGVESFCIGSELRGLTQLRGPSHSFPAVTHLRNLAAEVRAILGPNCKISYAADWSEYFGYHIGDNVYFHLDPLWADANIDYIGIDNYMPIADWRDGDTHADAAWGSPYHLDYLRKNIAGGEGFDWYYASPEGEAAQLRTPIIDADWGEDWLYRYKDLRGWWQNFHHSRIAGVRAASPTAWVPASKPFRFTEYGCAAIDKGANQPNRFLDPKSSESGLPKYSNGRRDDLMQLAYFQAMHAHWNDAAQNPVSAIYNAPMLDFAKCHAWAWDARPFPDFPRNLELWSDGANYETGHWLNGRTSNQHLGAVLTEICAASGVQAPDLTRVYGLVRGYAISDVTTARAALQPLLMASATEVIERDGALRFQPRKDARLAILDAAQLVRSDELDGTIETSRGPLLEDTGRLRLNYIEAEASYGSSIAEAIFPDHGPLNLAQSELPLVLTAPEASAIAQRWMAEARVARDQARFGLPKSRLDLGAGDRVQIDGQIYRIDRIEQSQFQMIEALRSENSLYTPAILPQSPRPWQPVQTGVPVEAQFLDLPLLRGDEVAHAPYVGAAANPWPGQVAVWSSVSDNNYGLNLALGQSATIGMTETPLAAAQAGLWERGPALRVKLATGSLSSAGMQAVLAGENLAAIGDGSAQNWEVFQFTDAVLVAPNTYELGQRLRGQAGSDGIMPAVWPAGSQFVLINAALSQVDLPLSARGLARHYRIGRGASGYNGADIVHQLHAFAGNGLRPYPVAHLRKSAVAGGALISWVRRTRIDGDGWDAIEVPLSETSETYSLRVQSGSTLLREVVLSAPNFTYTAAMQLADGASGTVQISVAQRSDSFGNGPFRAIAAAL